MQIYSGYHNKVAKSDSAYIADFYKGMKKITARNIKRVVRQEGRKECRDVSGDSMTNVEFRFLMIQEIERTAALVVMHRYGNLTGRDEFCRAEEDRLQSVYGSVDDYDYQMYRAGFHNCYTDDHYDDYHYGPEDFHEGDRDDWMNEGVNDDVYDGCDDYWERED